MRKLTRRYGWAATATVVVMLLTMVVASAAPIQSKMTTQQKAERGQTLARAQEALDAAGLTAKLKDLGLNDKQIQQRLGQLSADELQQLTSGAEAVAAGGAEPTLSTTTWLLVIVIVLLLAT